MSRLNSPVRERTDLGIHQRRKISSKSLNGPAGIALPRRWCILISGYLYCVYSKLDNHVAPINVKFGSLLPRAPCWISKISRNAKSMTDHPPSLCKILAMIRGYAYAKNIETASGPCNTCFWYALAPAVRNTSLGSASWRISYHRRSSVSKTRIAWARDRFYFYC